MCGQAASQHVRSCLHSPDGQHGEVHQDDIWLQATHGSACL